MNDTMLLTAKRRLKLYFNCRRRYLETDNHEELEFALLYLKEATELLIQLHQHGLNEATNLLTELELKRHIKLPSFFHTITDCPPTASSRYQPILSFCVCTCSSLLILTQFFQYIISQPAKLDLAVITPDVATSRSTSTVTVTQRLTHHESLLLLRNALIAYHEDHGIFPQHLTDLHFSSTPYLKSLPNEHAYTYRPHTDESLTVEELVVQSLQPRTEPANYYFSPIRLHICLPSNELIVADEHYIYFVFMLDEINHTLNLDAKSIDFLSYVTLPHTSLYVHETTAQFESTFKTPPLYYYPAVEQNRDVIQDGLYKTSDFSVDESQWLQEIQAIYQIPAIK